MTAGMQQPRNREGGRPAPESDKAVLVHSFVDAFNRLDIDWVVSELDPEVELHEWPTAPDAQTYHGHEGARQAMNSWFESWQWMQVEVLEIVELGGRALITLHQRAKGKGSEVEVEITSFNVYTFKDGRVVRIQLFTEREPALEAAGLSSANIAIVRQLFDTYERKDWEGLVALLHPEVELHEWPEGPDSRVYRGPDGVRSSREAWAEVWESIEAEPYDFVEVGERVFVPLHTTAKGRGSSVQVELDNFAVFTVRDSKLAKIEYFTDRDAALRAAGLSREKSHEEQKEAG
jgi:ketosteroid isomerase-like protein